MYIIKFQGGLGNQMFQYALYQKLENMGYNVKADLYSYNNNKGTQRSFEIEKVFGKSVSLATDKEIKELYAGRNEKIKKALIKRIGKRTYFREPMAKMLFHPEIFKLENAYLDGFWQSEKYFYDISDIIREVYWAKHRKNHEDRNKTVAIHVRMGDYLEANFKSIYGGICTSEYYHKAIEFVRSRIDKPLFIVFSDDMDKAKGLLQSEKGLVYAKADATGLDSLDLYRMANCGHQIIANSSYSWWAGWLNEYKGKIVIAPKKWINNIEDIDVVPNDWIRI